MLAASLTRNGDTLVVETRSFDPRASYRGSSPALVLIERYTRTSADEIDYLFTMQDPSTYVKEWTVGRPMRLEPADITIFDPDTINPLREEVVHDLPAGAWRMRELAVGIHYTIVNGQVLLEDGRHSGALPGRVLRNALYHEINPA